MTDGKSEAMELDLDPAQKLLATLAQAANEVRAFRQAGDAPWAASHLRSARDRISDARQACADLMAHCCMREAE